MMHEEVNDPLRDRMASAISQALAEEDEMVTKWVACVESIDANGARFMWVISDEGSKPWDNLGMLTFAIQREQVSGIFDDDGDG